MGPLTAGFERWANLPPSQDDLQSFGHAEITQDGELNIKLIGITGEIMWEKSMNPTKSKGGKKKKNKKNKKDKKAKKDKGPKRARE